MTLWTAVAGSATPDEQQAEGEDGELARLWRVSG